MSIPLFPGGNGAPTSDPLIDLKAQMDQLVLQVQQQELLIAKLVFFFIFIFIIIIIITNI